MILGRTRDPTADWTRLLDEHSRAVEQYRIAAGQVHSSQWTAPVAPGKWSPAEITAHLAQAYALLSTELNGGTGMRLRGSRLQRLVLRHTMLPRILRGAPFPPGVRAPREIRPDHIMEDRPTALADLASRAERFARALTAKSTTKGVRLTHAYFGPLTPRQGLELSIVHTRHHAQQLAAIHRSPPSS
ncbi:MAG TPA: DinB family protein [Gemmatimonadales bacterium]|nr:DinB family protein [Gemmatimonadales bacterium]